MPFKVIRVGVPLFNALVRDESKNSKFGLSKLASLYRRPYGAKMRNYFDILNWLTLLDDRWTGGQTFW